MFDDSRNASEEIGLRIEALMEKRNFHIAQEQEAADQAASHRAAASKCNDLALDYQRVLNLAGLRAELDRRSAIERHVAGANETLREVNVQLSHVAKDVGAAVNKAAKRD